MNYADIIATTTLELMKRDPKVIVLGEGVTDQKGIFGTTKLAHDAFPDRVIETPLSENMLTGALAGLASNGYKPIYVHARAEFSLLGMEHMVNTIAKWPWLHNGQRLPIVIRMLVGRGWGQGPTHSQNFASMFANVPGLEVVVPVYDLTYTSRLGYAMDIGLPTIMIEPRRLYDTELLFGYHQYPDVVIYTVGDIVIEAMKAKELLEPGVKVSVDPIQFMHNPDLYHKYTPAVICETGHLPYGVGAEIAARLAEYGNTRIKRIGPPFEPLPTAAHLEAAWYPSVADIVNAVGEVTGRDVSNVGEPTYAGRDGVKEPF